MTKPYKTIRAVVEMRVPQHITEKRLVWHLKDILKWPLQLGLVGDHETLGRAVIKSYSKVSAAEKIKEAKFWAERRRREWGL